jgi:hypothetical protein
MIGLQRLATPPSLRTRIEPKPAESRALSFIRAGYSNKKETYENHNCHDNH